MRKISLAFLCFLSGGVMAQAQQPWTTIPLNNLSAFNNPGKNWSVAAGASTDFTQPSDIKPANGTGIIINTVGSSNNAHLVTNAQMGDVELELEFMMAKGSNSGVYLQGRYEVQLFDSWQKLQPTYSDCGGIYQRWDESKTGHEGYQGVAPLQNVAKAPGLWQKLVIKFHAPTFNANGQKTANAWFESVYLNGVPVQLHVAVTGPTRSAMFADEKALGPLMLQGDHGNVAFRNIRYRSLTPAPQKNVGDNPITISADSKPYLLRSYLDYGPKKLTHVISAGYPGQLNYSYDLKQGALIQVWRGQFLDVTDMWHERGEPQLAKPLGALMILSDAPALAVLPSNDAAWPDSVAFDDFHNKGYVLDANRYATYEYEFNGMHVFDKISAAKTNSFTREIKVEHAPSNLYCRLAAAAKIEDLGKGFYAIDDRAFYIAIGDDAKPTIRQTGKGAELLLPVADGAALTYAIIW